MPETSRWIFRAGVRFKDAVATTPLCCPSRASILSGRYAHNHGVLLNSKNAQELAQFDYSQTFPAYLQRAGYETGIVGKFLNGWNVAQAPPYFDSYAITDGGYYDTVWNLGGEVRTVGEYSTTYTGRLAAGFIQAQEQHDQRPWLLYVATSAPHGTLSGDRIVLQPAPRYANAPVGALPGNPARSERNLSDKPPFWVQAVNQGLPPGVPNARKTRAAQLRMLMSVDDMVTRLARTLRRDGERRRTLVIFTSDNGLLWGEHGDLPIKDMPWLPSIRVPLAMRWPGHLRRGATDARLAANVDIAPTILDAAGIAVPASMDGRSLLRRWQRPFILTEYFGLTGGSLQIPPWASLYAPHSFAYDEYYQAGGSSPPIFREYYDLRQDPWQLDNLLGDADPTNDPYVGGAAQALASARSCSGSSCP